MNKYLYFSAKNVGTYMFADYKNINKLKVIINDCNNIDTIIILAHNKI